MTNPISPFLQQSSGHAAQAACYARTGWTVTMALIAVIGGISTLNMVVAHLGVATLNDVASPFLQQLARFGRQA